jgi:tRNA (Thr-GGU) A37 N-methylase
MCLIASASDVEAISIPVLGTVVGGRRAPVDDAWGSVEATIELVDDVPDGALDGLEDFSHLEVIFLFDRIDPTEALPARRRPRGRQDLLEVGVLAQRNAKRRGRLGLSRCEIVSVEARSIAVRGLDAIDRTPVLDVKPWFDVFGPRGPVREPSWVSSIVASYYEPSDG